ncbi:MAG TPA: HisA/HisF-related TIM barrel protein, partial [Gemmatimonadales bacterium]|nr:HisA/HisF-related TIM barrel protein [Gemmatimonadales bacterium]
GDNLRAIERIIAAVGGRLRVQLGGGLRSLQRIEEGLALGAARVVVGTAAVKDPGLLPEAVRRVGAGRLAAGVDARDGVVAVRGWRESGGERVEALAPRILESGIRTIVYTDISRDGMLAGPDLRGALAIRALGADVVVSGGVSSLGDLRAVRDAGLAGAIVGRALYEGRFDAADALAVAAARS